MSEKHEIRRPEVLKLAKELQKKHPDWTWEQCVVEAKHKVTSNAKPMSKV